jgi:hypothetical protein
LSDFIVSYACSCHCIQDINISSKLAASRDWGQAGLLYIVRSLALSLAGTRDEEKIGRDLIEKEVSKTCECTSFDEMMLVLSYMLLYLLVHVLDALHAEC